ncbi:MAG: hypothetical protein LAT82_01585 [Nanoarchaeota archaeon]|nr:hypothetical protein [Nanoarchaeota archaeon]
MTKKFTDPRFRKIIQKSGGVGTIESAIRREANAFRESKEILRKKIGENEFKSLEDMIKILEIPIIGKIACHQEDGLVLGLYHKKGDGFGNDTHYITPLTTSRNIPRIINDYMEKEKLSYRV